jgi:hypothetical protein
MVYLTFKVLNLEMAEFCKKHSREMGFPFEGYPVFCESCGKDYHKKPTLIQRLFLALYNKD